MFYRCTGDFAYGDIQITFRSDFFLFFFFMNFSRNFGVFPFQATVRGNSSHRTSQSKAKSVMLAQPRAKTRIKTILLRISKLCQLRTASNKLLHVIAQISHTATAILCQLNINFYKKGFFSPCILTNDKTVNAGSNSESEKPNLVKVDGHRRVAHL